MSELKTRELKGVEILDVGTWETATGMFAVTEEDLDTLVSNFDATEKRRSAWVN
ncbi:MAG TPA: hypothetical protein VGR87_03935 [Candidatus Limnocylindria bacterium]|jgi:hypothetical protein|nr:hypothetical protein [Candidatus Limnocylindria bacterium]